MDDIRAVMDTAGSERAVLFGFEEGFALCAIFAASYPDRAVSLLAFAGVAASRSTPDFPWGAWEDAEGYLTDVEQRWGTTDFAREEGSNIWPDIGDDPAWWADYATAMRRAVSPGDAEKLLRTDSQTDVRDLLPAIRVPTLLLHRTDDQDLPVEQSRYIAEQIPGAILVELPGKNHGYMAPDQDEVLDEVARFLRRLHAEEAEFDRVLATVLFTDIVGSTERSADLGDRAWREVLEGHHAAIRAMLARYRGTEIDTAGDGFFASFDGPARAIRCALAIVDAVAALGLQVRAGIHTGEVETIDNKVGGIAVAIGARVGALAQADEVLVSSTVKDLTIGSGLVFEDAGEHELKGVPDRWRLYRAMG
jgi:class 3 adenylate cyclase